jgi:hypothetical protein
MDITQYAEDDHCWGREVTGQGLAFTKDTQETDISPTKESSREMSPCFYSRTVSLRGVKNSPEEAPE